jgi:spermidine synthase
MEYNEKEDNLSRRYVLNGNIKKIQTEKTLLEIVPTQAFGEMVFMDGVLQLAKKDEYIYHEMLVHPAMTTQISNPYKNICILGGGDGCCLREICKWQTAFHIDVYDWDEEVVKLFSNDYSLWNWDSFTRYNSKNSQRVHIHIQDVLDISGKNQYDLVFVDLVDPNYEDKDSRILWETLIPKLPTLLNSTATLVINGGGICPWNTKNTDWILLLLAGAFQKNETHTIEIYKTFVPSFASDWCFFLIKPINTRVNPKLCDTDLDRYMGTAAWLLASTWTKDYECRFPTKPVKLNGYLPPV